MNSTRRPDAKRIAALAFPLLTLFALSATGESAQAALVTQLTNFQPIESPSLSSTGTFAVGVSGNTVVGGFYAPPTVSNGFMSTVSGGSFVPYNVPSSSSTVISGISGNKKVGSYTDAGGTHGFLVDGSTLTALDYPAIFPPYTVATGIDGTNIVGYVSGPSGIKGFLYDGSQPATNAQAWSLPVNPPAGAQLNVAFGISGSEIVGYYLAADNHLHGFMQPVQLPGGGASAAGGSSSVLASFTTLDYPGSTSSAAYGISGNIVVGDYQDSKGKYFGFVYDGVNWLSVDAQTFLGQASAQSGAGSGSAAGAVSATKLYGISGNTIVGEYLDANGVNHGFSVQFVPEPSTAALLAIGAALAVMVRHGRRSRR
jgi:PEP-CTERM motif-containing protein